MVGLLPTIPPFVLPYKRFAAPWLFSQAKQYLNVTEGQQPKASKRNATRITYRSAVRHGRQKIGYPIQQIDEHENKGPEGPRFQHQPVVAPSLAGTGGLSRGDTSAGRLHR